MTVRKPLARVAAAAAVMFLTLGALPASAAPAAKAASADAYGLLVDTILQPTNTVVRDGPRARASQDYPPGAAAPSEAQVQEAGPVPADGTLVNHVGVITSIAGATDTPQGVASAQANDVSLLKQGTTFLVTADVVRAQANSDCVNVPNGTGTTFVNLVVNGTPVGNTPQPNTVIDVPPTNPIAKVILNEQRPAFDGRGFVVNAIHVVSTTTGEPLFTGDIIVSHAMSTVNCTNGAGTTGETNVIKITKTVAPDEVVAGEEMVYTVKVTNNSTVSCLVNAVIDHLPNGFEFVSTAGDLGTALDRTPPSRPGGGIDLYFGNAKTITAGGTATQTIVARAGASLAPGVYYNNIEVFCANIGNFVKGLDAPVKVSEEVAPTPTPTPSESPSPSPSPTPDPGPLPHTGGTSPLWVAAGAFLVGASIVVRRLRPVG